MNNPPEHAITITYGEQYGDRLGCAAEVTCKCGDFAARGWSHYIKHAGDSHLLHVKRQQRASHE